MLLLVILAVACVMYGYAKACGYSDIVEIFRYERRPYERARFRASTDDAESALSGDGVVDDRKDTLGRGEFKKARGKESAARAVVQFRRLVSANLGRSDHPVFASLTYRENMEDIDQARADFNAFAKRAGAFWGRDFRYIAIFEFQRRGAIHYHALFWGIPVSVVETERSTRLVATLWGHGFTDLVQTDGSKKLSTYLSKYMAKNFRDPRLFGRKAYICSRNIKRPWSVKDALLGPFFTGVNDQGVDLSTAELLQSKEYDTQWLGRAIYQRYLLNPLYGAKSNNGER